MKLDPLSGKWSLTMNLDKGKYFYKYVINNEWLVNPKEQSIKGSDGIVNNFIEV